MQVTQLSMYSKNVPKFEASVIVRKVFGNAAILSWVVYPKLDQKPCGKAWMAESAGGAPLPKKTIPVIHPTTAEMTATVQMALFGVRVLECSMPKCSGTSWTLPIAYVT